MTKVPDHFPIYISPETPQDWDYSVCDGCEGKFEEGTLHRHEDGNTYCDECNYETAEDRADARADDLYHSMKEDGEL